MSLCLERWQDSKLKQERTINPQSIQSQLRTNSVHSAQGLQQLRADSDHPKGVFFLSGEALGKLRSTRGPQCLCSGRLAQLCTGKPFLTCICVIDIFTIYDDVWLIRVFDCFWSIGFQWFSPALATSVVTRGAVCRKDAWLNKHLQPSMQPVRFRMDVAVSRSLFLVSEFYLKRFPASPFLPLSAAINLVVDVSGTQRSGLPMEQIGTPWLDVLVQITCNQGTQTNQGPGCWVWFESLKDSSFQV